MKKIFAALASAMLVSTAFAQTAAPTAAPAMSSDQQTQAAGQANLKAGSATSTDAAKTDATAKQASTGAGKTEAKARKTKGGTAHVQKAKAQKVSKKKHSTVASAEKTKASGEAGKEASTAPVKTDGAKTDTTQTN
jgi:hypothetical protein